MGKKKDDEELKPEGLEEGTVLEGEDLLPVVESTATLIVPKKGKVFEERTDAKGHKVHVGKFAVIRPCMSRGRRLRGFSPIYESSMLAEHASVFSGWPMYADHLAEQIKEAIHEQLLEELGEAKVAELDLKLREAGRSIRELGGRLVKTWFDPELVTESDEEFGYRKGGVVGDVIPQPFIYEMLEADPGILNVSINAWPKRVKIGRPSWDSTKRGAVIEGISAKPMGSVDFVFKGGAGGAPLTEALPELAVTISESAYSSHREDADREPEKHKVKKLSEMSEGELSKLPQEDLIEALREQGNDSVADSIAEAAKLAKADKGKGKSTPSSDDDDGAPLTRESLTEALTEQREELTRDFETKLTEVKESGDEELREREDARSLEGPAKAVLAEAEKNGLPKAWVEQITPRYSVLSEGIGSGLKLSESDLEDEEGTKLSEADAIKAKVTADINTAIKLMEASGGTPRVKGFGQQAKDPQAAGGDGDKEKGGDGAKKPLIREAKDNAFIQFLVESGDLSGDDEKDRQRLSEMVEG